MVDSNLDGQVALVTGASRNPGLGLSIARTLGRQGATLMLAGGRNQAVLQANVAELRAGGIRADGACTDLTEFVQVQSLVERTVAQFGRIDILIHCASGRGAAPIVDMAPDLWTRILRVNLDGAFHLTKAVAPHMMRAGRGRIVFMAGISGQTGDANRAHVVAAKGGIMSFVKGAASELGPYGITVNAVSPGIIDTPRADGSGIARRMQRVQEAPLRRLGSGSDIAATCAFLVCDAAGFITGQTISVNGGSYM